MVGLELLMVPVGLAEVMMIVRLGLPRPIRRLLPGPLLLRLLTIFQLLRSDVNLRGKRRAGRETHLQQIPEMRLLTRLF
jgi:hypothetical protein